MFVVQSLSLELKISWRLIYLVSCNMPDFQGGISTILHVW